jgi:hypothetical protein
LRWFWVERNNSVIQDGTVSWNSDETITRVGKWTKEENSTLKDAIVKHNGKNWKAITELALVPGRTKKQWLPG